MGLHHQRAPGVRPLERFGRLVEVIDKGPNARTQILDRREVGALDHASDQDAEPDLDLIEPGRMRGRIDEVNAMRRIVQKHLAAHHGLEVALCFGRRYAFTEPTFAGDQLYQTHRLMDIQLVDHENPASFRIAGNAAGNMRDEIVLLASWSQRHLRDLTTSHLEVDDRALGAMPDILEFTPLHPPRSHRFARRFALQCLNAGQFVAAHHMHSQAMQQRGVGVQGTNGLDVLGEGDWIRFGRVQPIAAAMRLELGLILKSD